MSKKKTIINVAFFITIIDVTYNFEQIEWRNNIEHEKSESNYVNSIFPSK